MITRHCLCGASIRVRAMPATVEAQLAAEFVKRHTGAGDGHGIATARQAADARRREDLALVPREDA